MSRNIFRHTMVEMTFAEVEQFARQDALVLLPVGVIEEHGRHLPLGTDFYLAVIQAEDTAEEMRKHEFPCIIAPPFYWGTTGVVTKHFPGSFISRPETIKAVLHDMLECLAQWGFTRAVLLNAHGDPSHRIAITEALKTFNESSPLQARWLTFKEELQREGFNGDENYILPVPFYPLDQMITMTEPPKDSFDVHAGAYETAVMRDTFPDLTDMATAITLQPTMLKDGQIEQWVSGEQAFISLIPDGHTGDPAGSQHMTTDVPSANRAIARSIIQFYRQKN